MAAFVGRMVSRSLPNINETLFLVKHQACPAYNLTQVMYMRSKHYSPLFRTKRKEKTAYFDKDVLREDDDLTYLEKREKLKAKIKDLEPDRVFKSRKPSTLETPTIFDPYVPEEGDGKHSLLRIEGVKEVGNKAYKKVLSRAKAVRRIKKFGEQNFSVKEIAPELMEIYIEAHNLLTNYKQNKNRLHEICTLNAMNLMSHNMDRMTLSWEYVESLEPPRVVHVTCEEGLAKDIYFAQVTLRIHSKQKVALYDQFGRLMLGSPFLEKDVLDFVVFEKNIVDLYGKWRLHDKIRPEWLPQLYKNQSVRLPRNDDVEEMEEKA